MLRGFLVIQLFGQTFDMVSFAIVVVLVFLAILLAKRRCKKQESWRHRRYRKKAVDIYERLRSRNLNSGQIIVYLRKINPYVFEELVLHSFHNIGYKVVRNERYSGDGGVDGKVYKDGAAYLIQCKRYKSYISQEHLLEFYRICRESGSRGYFVHTGKTGRGAKARVKGVAGIRIISGLRLVDLINGTIDLS